MVGIRELAEHLGLSIWTISRALNGKPDVSAATRARVLEAAKVLGYQPNYSGIALKTGRTGIVGFLIRTGAEIAVESNMFFLGVIDGVQSVLTENGLDMVALLCPSTEDPDLFLQRVVARKFVDAIIVTGTRRVDPRVQYLKGARIPFVTLGRTADDSDYLWFDADIDLMAKQAADRLVAAGHRQFGIFSSNDGENFNDQFVASLERELAERGLAGHLATWHGAPNHAGGHALTGSMLADGNRPTALVVLNEAMMVGVYAALQERGLQPGTDIALLGRESPQTQFLYPSLTCFRLPLREIGVDVANGLLSTMKHGEKTTPDNSPVLHRLWEAELMIGDSDRLTIGKTAISKSF